MRNIHKDIECIERSSSNSLEVVNQLNKALIDAFKKRIKNENPKISKKELTKKLRKELHG